jgi:hypothetical protein
MFSNPTTKPATGRLLNYNSSVASGAGMSMRDRNNPKHFPELVPVGLSQLSHLPNQVYNDLVPGNGSIVRHGGLLGFKESSQPALQ